MKKGESTRQRIIEQTAPLFNTSGFAGASMNDILEVTGLKKGGVYNHFGSKEELALEAFDYAAACVAERIALLVEPKNGAVEKLLAFGQIFVDMVLDPPIPGGCPILNTAVESDDTNPVLRERAQRGMDRWRARIGGVIADGRETGELRPDVDADVVATRILSTLEGGLMMSRLYGDPVHVLRALDFIKEYAERDLVAL